MPRAIAVTTPENVRIEYELAGLGTRGAAAIVDLLLQVLACLILALARWVLGQMGKWPGTTWASAALGIAAFVVSYGYFVFFETIWNGQTPGKRLMRLRTIREGGLPIDLSCAALRNLVRFVDFLPILYMLGTIVVLFSAQNKRLGDYAAGTLVVKERAGFTPQVPQFESAPAPVIPAREGVVRNIEMVTPEEFAAAKSFVERWAELEVYVREDLSARIARPMMRRLGMEDNGLVPYSVILTEIVERCAHERGMR